MIFFFGGVILSLQLSLLMKVPYISFKMKIKVLLFIMKKKNSTQHLDAGNVKSVTRYLIVDAAVFPIGYDMLSAEGEGLDSKPGPGAHSLGT